MTPMRSWKTTLGGALGALGTALMGIGVVPQLSGTPSKFLTVVAGVGFACNALGIFFGHLFAVDTTTVINAMKDQQDSNVAAIAQKQDK